MMKKIFGNFWPATWYTEGIDECITQGWFACVAGSLIYGLNCLNNQHGEYGVLVVTLFGISGFSFLRGMRYLAVIGTLLTGLLTLFAVWGGWNGGLLEGMIILYMINGTRGAFAHHEAIRATRDCLERGEAITV